MLKKILAIFLLLGFFVNITHAYFIERDHKHTIKEFSIETEKPTKCDDLCKYHFFFHQNFVLKNSFFRIQNISYSKKIETKLPIYFSIYLKSPPKPPKQI
ncbi:hypothetical protein [Nitrosophilus kaiyonis]|uniref:hypothetical protein n=1 Tax=Nitrosophilus kaiyonis TaxID=2930200 RepID=UPI002493065E|nr:hypothetical protein [Nitrosophilus kaiyonis]